MMVNIQVCISNLLHKAQAPFHCKYPGGLLKYVNDLESIYAELDTLNATVDPSDKLRSLLRQLDSMNSAITELLSQQCRDTKKPLKRVLTI